MLHPVFKVKKYEHEVARFFLNEISELAEYLNTFLDSEYFYAEELDLILPLSKSSCVEIPDVSDLTDYVVHTKNDNGKLSIEEELLWQDTVLKLPEVLDKYHEL